MEASLPLRGPGMSISLLKSHGISHTHNFLYRQPNYLLAFLSSTSKRRLTVSSLQPFNSMKVFVGYQISQKISKNITTVFSSSACSGVCWSGLSCHASLYRRGDRGQRSEGGPGDSDRGLIKIGKFPIHSSCLRSVSCVEY